jgi:phage gpG-like protein
LIKVKVEGEVPEVKVGGEDTMTLCALIMEEGVQNIFHAGGYGMWAPLKSRPFGPARLFRTGKLYGSLTPDHGEDWAEVSVPRAVPYGAYLHYGTKKMVPRPFMYWRDAMVREVLDIVGESVRFEQSLPKGFQ